jgi:hypothetical protein
MREWILEMSAQERELLVAVRQVEDGPLRGREAAEKLLALDVLRFHARR